MNEQNNAGNSVKFTVEELLSMFKTEAQSICKKPEDVLSIAESTLRSILSSAIVKYVRIV